MRIDLFAHFTTQEFRQAYLAIPLGAKGRRLDPIAIRTFVQAQRTTDIDVLWDMEQRLRVLDRYGIDLQVLTLCFPMVGGLEPEAELRVAHGHQPGAVQTRHWRGAGEAAAAQGDRASPRGWHGALFHRAPRWPLAGRSGGTAHPPAPKPLLEVHVPRYSGGGCQRLRLR